MGRLHWLRFEAYTFSVIRGINYYILNAKTLITMHDTHSAYVYILQIFFFTKEHSIYVSLLTFHYMHMFHYAYMDLHKIGQF